MSVNISALGNLNPVEPLDMDDYADQKERTPFQLPLAGRYVVRAPESFPETAFSATKNNDLSVQIDPTIVGPTNEGFNIRYQRVTAKTFDRDGRKASFLGDYLRANGVAGRLPESTQAIVDLVASTAGRTYEVELDWEASHRATGFKLKGMGKFPTQADGTKQSWVEHPTEKSEDGSPLRLRANLTIRRFIAQG